MANVGFPTGFDFKSWAGRYDSCYTDGQRDTTIINCDGSITWKGNMITSQLYPAGSGLPLSRAHQNRDPNYQATDGWFFRIWERLEAWEFVRFSNGKMTIRHFCEEKHWCDRSSPEGSAHYHSGATTNRQAKACAGKQRFHRKLEIKHS